MSMFRNVKERGVGLFSGHGLEGRKGSGTLPANRRARVLNLESLEHRQLLSVSPGMTPDQACDLGQYAAGAEQYTEPVAVVSTMDPTLGSGSAAVEALPDLSADDSGVAPVLADDAFAMTSSQQLGSGVLANDFDADGDEMVVSLESDAAHGQLTLGSNGLFTYRPDGQFSGVDSFTYTVSDGTHVVGPATVTIEVTAVESHSPEAVEDSYSLSEDTSLTVSRSDGLLANDTDADGDPLYANLVSAPEHGTLTMGRYGSFTYTPDQDFNGVDQFTYMASDIDGEGGLATVTLTVEAVNDAPVSADDAYAASEDEALTIDAAEGVLANDSDVDGDLLSVSIVDEPSHGTVTLNKDGSFVYTPESDFYGEDSFTYVASDGQVETEVASVTIMVEAVNDAPTATADEYAMSEDEVLTVEASDGVLANDSDVEGDAMAVNLVAEPSHGTVTLAEDGSFEYTPEPGFHGEDSFTYVASDGQAESTETLVAIAVESINDVPVSEGDAYTVAEDSMLTVDAVGGVLANDADADGDTLTASLVDEPSHGSVVLAENGAFEYKPAADFHGEDSFTYIASDGQAEGELTTVAITVEAVNDAPVSVGDAYSVAEDDLLTVDAVGGVLANDADVDGDTLTVSLVDEPSHGSVVLAEDGSFEYKPAADFHGEDSFTYIASDGQAEGEVTTVAITVEAVDDAPVSVGDAYSVAEDDVLTVDAVGGVLANDADADGDALTVSLVDEPSHGSVTLAEDGSFEYIPAADFNGEDCFTYIASDGQAEGEVTTVAITVEAVNDAPVSAGDAYSVAEDEVLTVDAIGGVLANDLDVDGDTLNVSLVDEPSYGTVTLAEDGSFVYTPEADFHGEDSFTYIASDGQAEGEVTTVAITVDAVNDLPVSAADSYGTDTGSVLAVDATSGVLANDSDIDGDALTARLIDSPTNGTVVLGEDGSFEYTPDADFDGIDSFTYVSSDGQAESEATSVAIEVTSATVEELEALLSIQLQVSATPFGAEAETLWTESTFWVNAFVEDLRDLPAGVIGGAIDLIYDAMEVTPTGEVVYGDAFDMFQQGEVNGEEGLVDEAGALTSTAGVGADEAAPFMSWQFVRTGDAITTQFVVDPAEGTSTILPSNFALTDSGVPVEWADVDMGSADVNLIYADFNGDQLVDHFDLALWVPHSGTADGDVGYDSKFDLNANSVIDQADLDLLTSGMYTLNPVSEDVATAEELGSALDDALTSAIADLDCGLEEGESEESDPVQALDDLFANGGLWA